MVATLTFDEQGCAMTRNGTMIHRQALISNQTDLSHLHVRDDKARPRLMRKTIWCKIAMHTYLECHCHSSSLAIGTASSHLHIFTSAPHPSRLVLDAPSNAAKLSNTNKFALL